MRQFLLRRMIRSVIVLWGITTVVFVVMRLSGDPIALLVTPETPAAEVERLRRQWGLDASLLSQYVTFLGLVIQGDFGDSIRFNQPAMNLVIDRIWPTWQLAFLAIVLAVSIAVPVGLLSALRPNGIYDNVAMAIALIGQSMPAFLLGILLIMVFSVQLNWLPTGGRGDWKYLVMPTITLAAWSMASIARMTRSAMLDEMGRGYIQTARAKGLAEKIVVVRHALKNVAIPLITMIGLQFGALLGGAIVTETIFAWPGLGRLVVDAINSRDYPVVQASVFVIALIFLFVNLVVDILYAALDPRIKFT